MTVREDSASLGCPMPVLQTEHRLVNAGFNDIPPLLAGTPGKCSGAHVL